MDWPTLLAILTVVIGLYTAVTTRRNTAGEIFKAAMDAAKDALEIRERDQEEAQKHIADLVKYNKYLHIWIKLNCSCPTRPISFDEFTKTSQK